ncbi:MAG TPA: septal ring lytic transglycosylase RlpA family protein [Micromonosporaceae bacterium]
MNKKRSRLKPSRNTLPAAAALTVAGFLIGGAGAVIQLSPAPSGTGDLALDYDPANYPPPDRNAAADKASRDDQRAVPDSQSQPAGNAAVVPGGTCEASFYDEPQQTANGETFDPDALTAAHKSLPFGSQVKVTNVVNGKSVTVRINDRGPFVPGRCLDLSREAFEAISSLGAGVVDVRYEVLVEDAT